MFKSILQSDKLVKTDVKLRYRPYNRLHSKDMTRDSEIGTRLCPPVVSIYSNDRLDDLNVYPIAIRVQEKRFLPELVLKAAGESSEFFFVVQNSYNNESLHCEHTLFKAQEFLYQIL